MVVLSRTRSVLVVVIGVLVLMAGSVLGAEPVTLTTNGARVLLNAKGGLVRIERPAGLILVSSSSEDDPAGVIEVGAQRILLDRPTQTLRQDDRHARFDYAVPSSPGITVELGVEAVAEPLTLRRTATLQCRSPLVDDLTVRLPMTPGLGENTWLPRQDGIGAALGDQPAALYRFAGTAPGSGVPLAIPLVTTPLAGTSGIRATVVTDPFFTTRLTRTAVEWTYPRQVGLDHGRETRQLALVLHQGTADDALGVFAREALKGVPPGPNWLHEIALVDYDYMSDGGRGWYRDIEALVDALHDTKVHRQVFLCLHGWYDWLGRYSFDFKTKRLDPSWTAFGGYERVKNVPGFASCHPVSMSLSAVHERLRFAKDRGFRVGLYFADGLVAGTDLAAHNPRRVLQMGGWQGPDTPGQAYCQNPLVPEVFAFYVAYADALLEEFGSEIDALVWDETFTVPAGSMGSAAVPGYADRAMMRLVRAVAERVEAYNRDHHREVALLASDCLGTAGQAPYALMAHGTYQDTWCQPKAWSYAIFSNYRNVVWSCCWQYVSKWPWVEFGVRNYQAPVAISNGWSDNQGFSELPPDRRAAIVALFRQRQGKPTRLHWFTELPSPPRGN